MGFLVIFVIIFISSIILNYIFDSIEQRTIEAITNKEELNDEVPNETQNNIDSASVSQSDNPEDNTVADEVPDEVPDEVSDDIGSAPVPQNPVVNNDNEVVNTMMQAYKDFCSVYEVEYNNIIRESLKTLDKLIRQMKTNFNNMDSLLKRVRNDGKNKDMNAHMKGHYVINRIGEPKIEDSKLIPPTGVDCFKYWNDRDINFFEAFQNIREGAKNIGDSTISAEALKNIHKTILNNEFKSREDNKQWNKYLIKFSSLQIFAIPWNTNCYNLAKEIHRELL